MRSRTLAAIIAGVALAVLSLALYAHRSRVPDAPVVRPSHGSLDPQSRAAALDASLRALEEGEQAVPRDRWDPAYVVEKLERDPQLLFAWVRDQTFWVPYRGVLRGPVGVLMDREGNSLDRAVLLATLLEGAGQTVRLAHNKLSRAQTLTLLPRLRLPPMRDMPGAGKEVNARAAVNSPPEHTAMRAGLRQAAGRYGLNENSIEASFDSQQQTLVRIKAELDARVSGQTQRLLDALGHPTPDAWGDNLDEAIGAMQEHWWVQWQNGGRWSDLDPLLPGGRTAAPSVAATETIPLAELEQADVHQEIVVRVVAERWSERGLSSRTVLEHTLRPAALIGQSIVLQSLPADWLAEPDASTEGSSPGRDWRAELLDVHEWSVNLAVGQEVVAQGTLTDTAADPEAQEKGGPMGGFASAFSATMSSPPAGQKAPGTRNALSAVWLEYEFHAPGAAPRTVRRQLFDLLGPAARSGSPAPALALDEDQRIKRALALSMQTQLLPQVCQLAPAFVLHLGAQTLLGSRDLLALNISGDTTPHAAAKLDAVSTSAAPLSPLYALGLARMQWNPHAAQIFLGTPNLLTSHTYLMRGARGPVLASATDIVTNDIGVLLAAEDPFRMRVEQGVIDTNAESLLRVGERTVGNVGDAYQLRGDWVAVMADQAGAGLGRLKLSADAQRRIATEVGDGGIVIAPQSPVAIQSQPFTGWWRIDPNSGGTLGYGDNGWGEAAEYSGVTGPRVANGITFRQRFATFSYLFTTTYAWCLVQTGVENLGQSAASEERKEYLRRVGPFWVTLKESPDRCGGDALAIGLLGAITMPLVAVATEASEVGFGGGPKPPPELPGLPETPVSPRAASVPKLKAGASEPAAPGETPPPDQCQQGATEGEGTPAQFGSGRAQGQPFDPNYLQVQYNEALEQAAAAEKQLGPLAAEIEPAEQAYDAARLAYDQAQQARYKALSSRAPPEEYEQAIELEKQAHDKMIAARVARSDAKIAYQQAQEQIQREYSRADYYKGLEAPNANALQALRNQQSALQEFDTAFCNGSGFNGPAYENWQAANRAYESALQELRNAESGRSSAAGPGGGSDPTMPDPHGGATPFGNAIDPNWAMQPAGAAPVNPAGAMQLGNAPAGPPAAPAGANAAAAQPNAPPSSAFDTTMAGTAGVIDALGSQ